MKTLKEKYPKCFKPLHRLKVKKIIGYKNRPPFKVWYKNLCKN